jgi:hypothetical protein
VKREWKLNKKLKGTRMPMMGINLIGNGRPTRTLQFGIEEEEGGGRGGGGRGGEPSSGGTTWKGGGGGWIGHAGKDAKKRANEIIFGNLVNQANSFLSPNLYLYFLIPYPFAFL